VPGLSVFRVTLALSVGGCLNARSEVIRWVATAEPGASVRGACTPPAEQVFWFGEGPDVSSDRLYWFKRERDLSDLGFVSEAECDGRPCVGLRVKACAERAALVSALSKRFEGERLTTGRRIGVRVTWSGPTKPRCDRADPGCGPVPYGQRRKTWEPVEYRGLLVEPARGPECRHDGECMGVDIACSRWDELPVEPLRFQSALLESAWCGCVEQRCQWFVP
jgi:hypothetical protein